MEEDIELSTYLALLKITDKKLTYIKFAKALGIDKSYLSRIKTYTYCPSVRVAMKIEKITGGKVRWWKLMEKCLDKIAQKKNKKK